MNIISEFNDFKKFMWAEHQYLSAVIYGITIAFTVGTLITILVVSVKLYFAVVVAVCSFMLAHKVVSIVKEYKVWKEN